MKSRLKVLAICFLFISGSLIAQEDDQDNGTFFSGWEWGIKAGVNLSNMFGDVGDNSFLFFAHAGAVADKVMNENWRLGFEPHLSVEGQNLNGGYDRILYLNLPFLAKFPVADQLTLDGGVHFGVKLYERTKFGTTGETVSRDRFKTIAPGFSGGVTYDVDDSWFVQFRTNLKLSDVVSKDGGDSEGSTILCFQLSVGKRFN